MSEKVHTEEYKGYTINIYQDYDAQNPFEDWDCEPPLAVYSERSITEYATQYGNVNQAPTLDRDTIKKNWAEIKPLLEIESIFELRYELGQYGNREDCINDCISRYLDNLGNSDRLELLETLYNMAGIPALLKSVHGYCQGDYAEVLAVATPEFQEACGNGDGFWDDPEKLKPSIDLFEHWAYGNVYGYSVKDADGEEVDSCWGFFGDYDDEYGALSEAKSAADSHAEQARKDHIAQVKTWIRHRVPHQYRTVAA